MLFLEKTHPQSCIAYLQHIIGDLKEVGADFHDKLSEMLLIEAKNAPAEGELDDSVLSRKNSGVSLGSLC